MISITSAPEAPPPRIRILDARSREVETVRIGDKLTFRIEIPEDSKYLALPALPPSASAETNGILSLSLRSTVRHLRPQLRRHGQGLEEHVPDHRRRGVRAPLH